MMGWESIHNRVQEKYEQVADDIKRLKQCLKWFNNMKEIVQMCALFTMWGIVQSMRWYPGKLPDLEKINIYIFQFCSFPLLRPAFVLPWFTCRRRIGISFGGGGDLLVTNKR